MFSATFSTSSSKSPLPIDGWSLWMRMCDLAELQIRRKQIPGGLTHEHYVTA